MGIKLAMLYGAGVLQVSPDRRAFLRSQVGLATFGSTKGRSRTLAYAVHSMTKDPSLDATRAPLALWHDDLQACNAGAGNEHHVDEAMEMLAPSETPEVKS